MINNSFPEKELYELDTQKNTEDFIEKWCSKEPEFHQTINAIIAKKGISISELMHSSRINRNYGYNILNGRRKNPGRDKVLSICIAAKLSVKDTQELLMIAKVGGLYYRCERDVRIAAALNNEIGDVIKMNIILESKGLEPLSV